MAQVAPPNAAPIAAPVAAPPAPPAPAEGLRDIVNPVPVVDLWKTLLTTGLIVLALALIAAAIYLWWRARQRRLSQPQTPAPPLPPHVWAHRQLEDALRWLSDPDRFCTEVSRILREYLERRFGWNAPDRTTEEFLAGLRRENALPEDQRAGLEDFLNRCDLVKFARHDPTEPELLEIHGVATRLVSETTPTSPVLSGPADAPTSPPAPAAAAPTP